MTDVYAEELLEELEEGMVDGGAEDFDAADDLDDALDDGDDLGEDGSVPFMSDIVGSFDTRADAEHWIAEQAKAGVDTTGYVIVDDGICFNVTRS